ncbi:LIC12162 family protein [Gammaproteobacteria bacterium]|nr:LIC12162 family protein [Gammaproteobacteria bacterium]
MPTYLVTTAEESTWPHDGKVVFLGEWCKNYKRKHKWSKFDSTTARPYAISAKEKESINEFRDVLFNDLLYELSEELNRVHNTNYSKRYWDIIVGPWLQQAIKVFINRYGVLNQALSENDIDKSIVSSDTSIVPSQGSLDFKYCLEDDIWNYKIYCDMLRHWPDLDLEIVQNDISLKSDGKLERRDIKPSSWKSFIKPISKPIFKIATLFSRKSDALIFKSYLPPLQELKLQVLLGQFPQLWSCPAIVKEDSNKEIRDNFFQGYKKYSGMQKEVRRLIGKLIPVCYLEGYKSVNKQIEHLPWPSQPKFIFTSNSFSANEVFQFWTAKMVELGVPYYIGQHGNNYGTLKGYNEWIEVNTCDRFYSWGEWTDHFRRKQVIPAFVLTLANINFSNDKKGGLLLIKRGPGRMDGCHDRGFEHILYRKNVLNFFSCLDKDLQNETTVRLHLGSTNLKSADEYTWKKKYKNITIDNGTQNIHKLIKRSRIVVHSYDSTGILETLSLNIPTIAFWINDLNLIISEVIPDYQLLIDANIVHLDAESAANHINKYWDNIDDWWESEEVQDAREIFCNKYAKKIKNPIKTLKYMLLN